MRISLAKYWYVLSFPALVAACGSDGSATDIGGAFSQDFQRSVPGDQQLALTLDDGGTGQGLTLADLQALVGSPSEFRPLAARVVEHVTAVRELTQDAWDALFADGEPVEVQVDELPCRQWEADRGDAHWRFQSCRIGDAEGRRYRFLLQGRPLAVSSDDAYLTVVAGEGGILPGDGHGAGELGYHFDNLATLTGADVSGRMGLGYRSAGGARQVVMAIDGVSGPDSDDVWSGLFRYTQIAGQGGAFTYVTLGDFVAPAAPGGFERGTDGIDEHVRVSMAWQSELGARAMALACDGTVGEGQCMRTLQCWGGAEAVVAFEETGRDSGSEPVWDEASCPEPPIEPEPVSETDESVPAEDPQTGAPQADEPAAIAAEEE